MIPLSADSTRRAGALRFGAALREAMTARKVGQVRLAEAAGCSTASINNYRFGRNIPTMAVARRLADALETPALTRLAQSARTITCDNCRRTFAIENGGPKRYCSDDCRRLAAAKVGGVPTRQRAIVAERALRAQQEAVAAMCAACEPDGACRTMDCPLRSVSPLQLISSDDRPARPVRPSDRNGESWRVASLAANARRWTPEARVGQSRKSTEWHAAMTPEEREAFASAVSRGRRA